MAVPPWVGYNEEETIQQQILALSAVRTDTQHSTNVLLPLLMWTSACFSSPWCSPCLQDKRNFLRDPPAGVQFHFDMEQMYPLAAVMLEEDQLLNRMRFDLVPKQSVVFPHSVFRKEKKIMYDFLGHVLQWDWGGTHPLPMLCHPSVWKSWHCCCFFSLNCRKNMLFFTWISTLALPHSNRFQVCRASCYWILHYKIAICVFCLCFG